MTTATTATTTRREPELLGQTAAVIGRSAGDDVDRGQRLF